MFCAALASTLALAQVPESESDAVFRALARGAVDSVLTALAEDAAFVAAVERFWDQRLLRRAVAMDLEVVVEALLAHGAAPGVRDRDGRTALHEASSASVATRLLAVGANPTALDDYGDTPLRLAVERSEVDGGLRAEALLAAGVPLDLASAVRLGRLAWVREELQGPDARRREARVDGRVLLEAARAGSVELIDALLAAGALVNGRVPVGVARDDYFERSSGPATPENEELTVTHSREPYGLRRCSTPLARASWRGAMEIVDVLLSGGAELDQPSNGAPALFHAALAGHDELAARLIARGPRRTPRARPGADR
jgi:hypothetical protein